MIKKNISMNGIRLKQKIIYEMYDKWHPLKDRSRLRLTFNKLIKLEATEHNQSEEAL